MPRNTVLYYNDNFLLRLKNMVLRLIPETHTVKRMSDLRLLKFVYRYIVNNIRGPVDKWKLLKPKVKYFYMFSAKINVRL